MIPFLRFSISGSRVSEAQILINCDVQVCATEFLRKIRNSHISKSTRGPEFYTVLVCRLKQNIRLRHEHYFVMMTQVEAKRHNFEAPEFLFVFQFCIFLCLQMREQ